MNKEQLLKSVEIIREYNDDLFAKLKHINRVQAGKSKSTKIVKREEVEEVLVLIAILLSGNIKVRYDLENRIKENAAFANLSQLKSIAINAKQDVEALKSASFSMTEVLKSIRSREEEQAYREKVL